MGERARVLEVGSFRKERKIEEEGELEEFCFRKGASGDQDVAGDYRCHGALCRLRGSLHLLLSFSLFPKSPGP